MSGGGLGMKGDGALVGELQGVVDDLVENPSERLAVGGDGEIGGERGGERELQLLGVALTGTLDGLGTEVVDAYGQETAAVEGDTLAGGKLEELVDDDGDGLGTGGDAVLHVVFLGLAELVGGGAENLGEAGDGVEGGAYLMTHGTDEGGLHAVGGVGLLLGYLELALALLDLEPETTAAHDIDEDIEGGDGNEAPDEVAMGLLLLILALETVDAETEHLTVDIDLGGAGDADGLGKLAVEGELGDTEDVLVALVEIAIAEGVAGGLAAEVVGLEVGVALVLLEELLAQAEHEIEIGLDGQGGGVELDVVELLGLGNGGVGPAQGGLGVEGKVDLGEAHVGEQGELGVALAHLAQGGTVAAVGTEGVVGDLVDVGLETGDKIGQGGVGEGELLTVHLDDEVHGAQGVLVVDEEEAEVGLDLEILGGVVAVAKEGEETVGMVIELVLGAVVVETEEVAIELTMVLGEGLGCLTGKGDKGKQQHDGCCQQYGSDD